jgi:SAM-dependent methyltransferase
VQQLKKGQFSMSKKEREDHLPNPDLVLDVGCGVIKRGDIGVDTRNDLATVDYVVDLNRQKLPFPDGSFRKVCSHHCIEHVDNPVAFLDELVRVARETVEVHCPYRLSPSSKASGHKHFFDVSWFMRYAEKRGLICNGVITLDDGIMFLNLRRMFRLAFPVNLEVRVWLVKKRKLGQKS